MTEKKKLIAGNWKMNGGLAANEALLRAVCEGLQTQPAGCDVAVAVPAPYLAQVQALLAGSVVAVAAQDVSAHASGAYTGEVSGAMLNDFGVRYALVGHSERRQYHGETDAVVAAKALRALEGGVTPVVCVGETLAEREADVAELQELLLATEQRHAAGLRQQHAGHQRQQGALAAAAGAMQEDGLPRPDPEVRDVQAGPTAARPGETQVLQLQDAIGIHRQGYRRPAERRVGVNAPSSAAEHRP